MSGHATVLVGAGKVGARYAEDPKLARHYRYISHAQVLAAHEAFDWCAVVDHDRAAAQAVADRYGVAAHATDATGLRARDSIEVAVLATPPEGRLGLLDAFPALRAVLVEKPLGRTAEEADAFLAACAARDLIVQVNHWRRADAGFRRLAAGGLDEAAGALQAVFGIYGNGLLTSGSHMIDFVRMLAGEVREAQATGPAQARDGLPIAGDVDVPFALRLESGAVAQLAPVDFAHYRENGLELWGTRGRVSLMLEGLVNLRYPWRDSRSTSGAGELAADAPEPLASTVGEALYGLYDNLAAALRREEALVSDGASALRNERIIAAIRQSAAADGRAIAIA